MLTSAAKHIGIPAHLAQAAHASGGAAGATSKTLVIGGARRWGSTGKNRFNMIRRRATEQHVDYFRQLKAPRPYRPVEVDPKLHRSVDEVRQVFGYPELTTQPSEHEQLLPLERITQAGPTYEGRLAQVDLDPFGTIEVLHDDIFKTEADAVLLPMQPNLMPYRGLSLETFDRGGKELVKETFDRANGILDRRDRELKDTGEVSGKGLMDGDTLFVIGRGVQADNAVFVVLPWFWQGSPMDAAKRFRFCVRRALLEVGSPHGFAHVALPNLGGGVHGYEPRSSSRILVEEAVEALLQIEAQIPSYKLRKISFVDNRLETAEALAGALTEVSHRWLPDRRVTTAAQYWGNATRRLIVLPAAPNFFWKRRPVKFKRYSGVKRNARQHYLGNIRPVLWRAHRVRQPAPLMVFEESGEVAPKEFQTPARPYFYRGVTHWLFPARRSGFHALRRNARGQWLAHLQKFRQYEATRPRL